MHVPATRRRSSLARIAHRHARWPRLCYNGAKIVPVPPGGAEAYRPLTVRRVAMQAEMSVWIWTAKGLEECA
jgi:hypothetical protein